VCVCVCVCVCVSDHASDTAISTPWDTHRDLVAKEPRFDVHSLGAFALERMDSILTRGSAICATCAIRCMCRLHNLTESAFANVLYLIETNCNTRLRGIHSRFAFAQQHQVAPKGVGDGDSSPCPPHRPRQLR
jgi:hypothetical protein